MAKAAPPNGGRFTQMGVTATPTAPPKVTSSGGTIGILVGYWAYQNTLKRM